MSTLGRAEIVLELRRVMNLSPRKAAKALQVVVRTIRAAIESGDDVHINGFGTLKPVYIRPRNYRSRQTGKKLRKNAARKIEFRPCTAFKPGIPTKDFD